MHGDNPKDAFLHTQRFTLPDKDTDVFGFLKPASAALYMQDLAELHASAFGNSRSDLLKAGAVWVLARTRAEFSRLPGPRADLAITTWPGRMLRSLFPRYYSFSADGEHVGSAVTLWMLVNAATHLPANPKEHGVFITGDPPIPPPFENPVRLRETGEPLFALTRRCSYSDLDYNRHMNNARYLEWVCDALNPPATPRGFQLNFLAEVQAGEDVLLKVFDGNLAVGFKQDGTRAFEGRLVF